jgi:hypothetical protein
MLPAHPRVVTWALQLEEPLGSMVTFDFLWNLQSLGLANRRLPDEWCLTPQGESLLWVQREEGSPWETIDLIAEWALQQGEAAKEQIFGVILPEIRRELEKRIEDSGESWRSDDSLRSGFVSFVLAYLTERDFGHGCELAYTLWSRAVAGGFCLSENEVAFINVAIMEDGADLIEHSYDIGVRLESLGYVEIVDGRALPLEAGRDATHLYEPRPIGWEE